MGVSQVDVTTDKGLAAFNGYMGSKSYVEGWNFSPIDSEWFRKFSVIPDASKYPHAYRWYIHIAALTKANEPSMASEKATENDDDYEDFDAFGDDDKENEEKTEEQESREEKMNIMKEAEERLAMKGAKQRTLVSIEIKPWDVDQDLISLWKKVTTTVVQDGLKWGEKCILVPVAFGIKKIQCSFTMGVNNSSDTILEEIESLEDEVQSVEITSMNVL